MCILFFALEQHPQYPVIICANRDEFHLRPTKAMHYWQKEKIYAGKDLQAGGTWLGLTAEGRFSALTNFRQGSANNETTNNEIKKSRGELVLKALAQPEHELTHSLENESNNYNGFNLVYGQLNKLHYFDSINRTSSVLPSGIHSLCNGALDDIWPKMALGQQQLIDTIKSTDSLSIEQLFDLMKNAQQAKPEHLPDTGIGEEWEQFLSSIFIVSPEYGTRTTTIITQDLSGEIEIFDRSYDQLGHCIKAQQFTLSVNA